MASYRCLGCRDYKPRPEYRRVGLGAVCSADCLATTRAKRTKKTPMRAAPDVSAQNRGEVLARDAFRCRFCGTRDGLHAHHIAYRSEGHNHSPSNLIMLCAEHHQVVHSDKGRWQPVCMTYIAEVLAGRARFLPELDREMRGAAHG